MILEKVPKSQVCSNLTRNRHIKTADLVDLNCCISDFLKKNYEPGSHNTPSFYLSWVAKRGCCLIRAQIHNIYRRVLTDRISKPQCYILWKCRCLKICTVLPIPQSLSLRNTLTRNNLSNCTIIRKNDTLNLKS